MTHRPALATSRFYTTISHFSEYGLGLAQGMVGETLPDVSAFGNDRFTGAATANYINRAANWGVGYTATNYDGLGRLKQVVAPNDETTEYKYVGRATRVTALGRGVATGTDRVLKWTESDVLGNLAIVRSWTRPWQAGDTPYAEIKLQHDLLGNLTRVEQPDGIVATMHDDLGGRKVAMNDPDLGNWRYGYDRLNRLTRQTGDAAARPVSTTTAWAASPASTSAPTQAVRPRSVPTTSAMATIVATTATTVAAGR